MTFSFKIKIYSFHIRTANLAILNIIYLIKKKIKKIKIDFFTKLPKETKLITVLKGPQINKKARNQFTIHKFSWFFSLSFKLINNKKIAQLIFFYFYFYVFKHINFSYISKYVKKKLAF